MLQAMLTDAQAEGLIELSPLRTPRGRRHGARLSDGPGDDRHLEPVEALALLEATPDAFYELVLCAFTTGFRRNELLGLRWEWIDWTKPWIDLRGQLRKGKIVGCKWGSERRVPLHSSLATLLGRRREAEGWIFRNPNTGRHWQEDGPRRVFLTAAFERAGLVPKADDAALRAPGRGFHLFRHTYASILAAAGVREEVRAYLLGHKKKTMTSTTRTSSRTRSAPSSQPSTRCSERPSSGAPASMRHPQTA